MELITSKFSGIVKYKCLCVSRVGNWNARWISLSRFISLSLTPCLPFCPRVTPCPYLSLLRFTISLFSYYLLSFSIPSLLYLTLPPLSVSRFLLSLSLSLSLSTFSPYLSLYTFLLSPRFLHCIPLIISTSFSPCLSHSHSSVFLPISPTLPIYISLFCIYLHVSLSCPPLSPSSPSFLWTSSIPLKE